jgi:DNA repair protein RadD
MQKFRDKYIQVLTNCALFDEGLDIPSLDGVILARPTQSLSRFLQMVGRALRPCEGKDRAIIIDLAGNWERLGMPDDMRGHSMVWRRNSAIDRSWLGIEKLEKFSQVLST